MGAMSPWHWAIVLIVLVLLFGSTRLPGAARGLGRSLRIFKSEMREMTGSDSDTADGNASSATPQALPQQQNTPQQQAVTPQQQPAPAQPQASVPQEQPAGPPQQQAATPQQNPPAPGTGA